jgi:hypothetical protein
MGRGFNSKLLVITRGYLLGTSKVNDTGNGTKQPTISVVPGLLGRSGRSLRLSRLEDRWGPWPILLRVRSACWFPLSALFVYFFRPKSQFPPDDSTAKTDKLNFTLRKRSKKSSTSASWFSPFCWSHLPFSGVEQKHLALGVPKTRHQGRGDPECHGITDVRVVGFSGWTVSYLTKTHFSSWILDGFLWR